ncbi:MAG: NifU N-terminal domain-containing protein [Candidatus Marinimicrobia bacterium]|nr:NifU N-terminal domain-containing protein [Candidatus Neomarinimicrobiota bacterium]MCF7829957.1 NifU N-terminal domain-containing protein [Candidatus Neomarinimicrobiota bacterium]MCF7881889.1 NifU N-terminal domain-containing protein [Candidatus Neomarinimicrobiota bacterium]
MNSEAKNHKQQRCTAISETILREFPPNPNLVNYHTRRQMTTMMSERYTPDSDWYPSGWTRKLGAIAGITNIHLMRHKLRLKRNPEMSWDKIIPSVEAVLIGAWEGIEIKEAPEVVNDRREFELPDGLYFEKRRVFEGVDHSKKYTPAEKLYEIPGITTLVFYKDQVTVKRGYCYPWEEIEPEVIEVLQNLTV